jgi:hypothetical protein
MSQIWGMSKTPTTAVKFRVVGKIRTFCFFPSLIEAAWCGAPLEMTEGTTSGARVQSAFKAGSAEWAPQQRPLHFYLIFPGSKQPERETDHASVTIVGVQKEYNCNGTTRIYFHCFTVHFNSLCVMVQLMHLFVIKH